MEKRYFTCRKHGTLFFLKCFLGLGVAFAANAEKALTPEEIKVKTPVYSVNGNKFQPRLGEYTYSVSWQGIPAATARITVDKVGDAYRVVSEAKTASGIDIFYTLRYKAQGLINQNNYRPIKTVMHHRENSKVKKTEIRFFRNGKIDTTRVNGDKDPVRSEFKTDNFTLDPFSAAFIARGVDWAEGKTYEFDTFDGKTRYLLTLTATGKDTIDFDGEEREVWTIVPTVQNLTKPETKTKLRKAVIYLTTDDKREILGITSKVFVGRVSAELEEYIPYPASSAKKDQLLVAKNEPLVSIGEANF